MRQNGSVVCKVADPWTNLESSKAVNTFANQRISYGTYMFNFGLFQAIF